LVEILGEIAHNRASLKRFIQTAFTAKVIDRRK